MAAVGRLTRSLGPEVEQSVLIIPQLGKGEPASVADLGIVHAELVPVIAQRQRLREVVRQRLEAAEMPLPILLAEVQSDAAGPAFVDEAANAFGEGGGLDWIVEISAEIEDCRVGPVGWGVGGASQSSPSMTAGCGKKWRPEPESNRRARICSPLRNHSAIGPGELRKRPCGELGLRVKPMSPLLTHQIGHPRASAQGPQPPVFR